MCIYGLTPGGGTAYQGGMSGKTLCLTATARYLGFSRRTLYNMLNDGRFPVKPIPGTNPRHWDIDDLDAWRRGQYPLLAQAGIE